MPNILVIPDIHHKTRMADAILDAPTEHHIDYIVFLGDYFDDFGDTPAISARTAEWLKESLGKPNRIHLMGNHDLHYRYWRHEYMRNPYTGWTSEKARAINDVLTPGDWDKLKWFHHEPAGNWLFSHAGLHPDMLPPLNSDDGEPNVCDALATACARATRALELGGRHPLFRAGLARGGKQAVGGIVWLDWHSEFVPFHFHQVVGHTPVSRPLVCFQDNDKKRLQFYDEKDAPLYKNAKLASYSLDTHLRHYAIINDDSIRVFSIGDILQ